MRALPAWPFSSCGTTKRRVSPPLCHSCAAEASLAMPLRGHAGSARVAVFFLRHNEAASFLAASSLLCRRKACRQSRATKGVTKGFGNSFAPLEPCNDRAGRRRPALMSPKSAATSTGSAALEPVSFPEWPPPYRGLLGFSHRAFAPLESATSERAAARPALTSPKRAAVMREAPPHWSRSRFPSGPRRIGARLVSPTLR
jgi:hypothetical protein